MAENGTAKELIDEIMKMRTELKEQIASSEANILSKLEPLQQKVERVERENAELRSKIEKIERDSRKKNIVIFGLNKAPSELSYDVVKNSLESLLKVEIREQNKVLRKHLAKPKTIQGAEAYIK
ncbi:hypothetical protein HHI36_006079, partial [Cryptolaemus montrouzieri]